MPRSKSRNKATHLSRNVVAALALALALAACQSGPRGGGTFVVGTQSDVVAPVPMPAWNVDKAARENYFVMQLPDEAPLPRSMVRVSGGGAPGSLNTSLSSSSDVVVTSVVPHSGRGFVIEGANLNRSTLKFYLGTSELFVSRRLFHTVTALLPNATMTGRFTIKDGGTTIFSVDGMDARGSYVFGRMLIRFREGSSREAVEKALQDAGVTYYRYPGLNYVVASHRSEESFDAVAAKLRTSAVIDQVTREAVFTPKDMPTDPRYAEQWALKQVNAEAAWAYTAGSPDVVVAVLDTGVQTSHPDLSANIAVNARETPGDGVDDDGNGRVDDTRGWNTLDQSGFAEDDHGHGTQAAGIIAAAANNTGIVGLAPSSRILPVKVATAEGLSTSASIVDGINYAVRNRASVIYLGMASPIADAAVRDAVEFATTFNVTCVAPMGNDGSNVQSYPAAWATALNMMAVGATNKSDARPSWGNYGTWMTVSAPGEGILTTTRGTTYTTVNGTSFSAALVAAQAALIKALKPSWTPAMVREMITQSAVDRGSVGHDAFFGHGRITMDSTAFGNLLGQLVGGPGIKASSEHELRMTLVDSAIDRDSETIWSSGRSAEIVPQWLRIDLGRPTRLTSIAALSGTFYSGLFPQAFQIQISDDDVAWRTVATETNFVIPETTWHRWVITPTTARYVRFNITGTRRNPDNSLYYAQIAEVAFNGEEHNIVINASSAYYGVYFSTKKMLDNDPTSMWVTTPRGGNQREFAIVDLGVSRSFRTFKLLSPPPILGGAFPKSIDFYTSNDKVNWVFVKSFKNLTSLPSTWYTFSVPDTTARYVRIDVPETNRTASTGSLYGGYLVNGHVAGIAEFKAE